MEVMVTGPGGGKTTWLVKKMVDDPTLVLIAPTMNQAEVARQLSRQFVEGGLPRDRFIRPFDNTSSADRALHQGKRFVIDEALHVSSLWHYNPVAITITGIPAETGS